MDGLGDKSRVAPLERFPASETVHVHPPVFGALRMRSVRGTSISCPSVLFPVGDPIGGGTVIVKSCRTRLRGGARVGIRGEVMVGALGTGRDFAASKILRDCCESIENGAHDIKRRK